VLRDGALEEKFGLDQHEPESSSKPPLEPTALLSQGVSALELSQGGASLFGNDMANITSVVDISESEEDLDQEEDNESEPGNSDPQPLDSADSEGLVRS
jgi:hypothetical protein